MTKMTGASNWLGEMISFIKQPIGLVTCIAVPLVILLIVEVINLIRLSRKPDEVETEEEERYEEELDIANEGPLATAVNRRRAMLTAEQHTPKQSLAFAPLEPAFPSASPVESLPDLPLSPPVPPAEASPQPPLSQQQTVKQPWQPLPPAKPSLTASDRIGEPHTPIDKDVAYPFQIHTEQANVPLEHPAQALGSLSYQKPAVTAPSENEADETREFSIKADGEIVSAPLLRNLSYSEKATCEATGGKGFSANVVSGGKDRFQIDGIDVNVKPDAIHLALDGDVGGREISITVTDESTHVTVGTDSNEVNFSLLRDDKSDGRKVIIRKKGKL